MFCTFHNSFSVCLCFQLFWWQVITLWYILLFSAMSDNGDGLVGPTRQLRQIPVLKTSCCARYIWRLCPESVAWSRLLSLYRNDSKLNRKVHSWLLLWAKIPTKTSLYWIGDIIHDISISRNRTSLGWPFVYSRRLHRFDGPRLQKHR